MSGGHYDYNQQRIWDIIDRIEKDISTNTDNDWYDDMPSDVIARMTELKHRLQIVAKLVKEADWLYSADTGPEEFCTQYDKIIRGDQ